MLNHSSTYDNLLYNTFENHNKVNDFVAKRKPFHLHVSQKY